MKVFFLSLFVFFLKVQWPLFESARLARWPKAVL